MKVLNRCMLLALVVIVGVLLLPVQQGRAQDTLLVEWQNPDLSLKIDALRLAWEADTVGGVTPPAGRVYKLKKGGYYPLTETITNDNRPLRIVGEAAGPGELENPPVLQMYRRSDNTVNQRMFTVQKDLVLKNLWITGADDIGTQTAYQPIQITGGGLTIRVDNCIFDRSNFAIIAFAAAGNKAYFTNNKFRNLVEKPITQQWTGRVLSIWADQDTVVFENNTMFNVGAFYFQMESGAIKYLRFNHNTCVNVGRNFAGNWWREAYFANNLFINPFWQGEGVSDYTASGRDPRGYSSGIWGIGPLPSMYGPEQGRRILFGYNAAWRDPQFAKGALYGDTVRAQYFIGNVTALDFLVGAPYPNMVVRDTTWLASRPTGITYPDTLVPKMWQSITDLRRGITPATPWFYHLPGIPGDTGVCNTCVDWPLPETFTYSGPANLLTMGSDGLPVGDLNWFPTQKATFEANKANLIKQLEDKAGPRIVFDVVETKEAEKGTLSGGAAQQQFSGFSYFQMDGGGYLEWTFDLAAGGQYDINIWTHMRGNSMRGQHTFINGTEIHDAAHGWGELIYDVASGPFTGLPTDQWTWCTVKQADINEANALTFVAGANKIKMSSSWGYQNFAGVDLLTPGTTTVVKSLRAPDVTDFSIVMPHGQVVPGGTDAKWVANWFKYVSMGTNGSVQWTVTPATAGNYRLRIFYQNAGTVAATGQVKVGGTTVIAAQSFPGKEDSTGADLLTNSFPLTAGSQTVSVAGSNFNLDYVQLIKETIISSVGNEGLPLGFALEQNYPNPFNPATKIDFAIGKASNVTLTVYNILGQRVATLVNTQLAAGSHSVQFDAKNLATGVYIYRLEAGDVKTQKKMMLLK